ncbi:hypothetical protein [Thalassorhabdomicrobium marinisediminis]|uniref:NADH dehydrogenase n=1 Tax=Thalassorhabdomicrobium marinisediminis TaxID=2170577 RepID=A0A2T7G0M5_9RHOB|nr:hypothetical protein [Thalassorhabdomicrobium marinisediminis]PVA07961.1 hypothetical protein DC363_00205 [Thalassorhabdomicrobium marinisediminis]
MKPAVALLAALTLTACGAGLDGVPGQTLPDGVTEQDVALFKTAATQAGCVIGPAQADQVRAATGFDTAKLSIITQYLTLAGESTPTDSGFRLTSGSCANA